MFQVITSWSIESDDKIGPLMELVGSHEKEKDLGFALVSPIDKLKKSVFSKKKQCRNLDKNEYTRSELQKSKQLLLNGRLYSVIIRTSVQPPPTKKTQILLLNLELMFFCWADQMLNFFNGALGANRWVFS